MNHLDKYNSIVPVFPESDIIPKIVHQTHWTLNFPSEIRENIEKLKQQNPDWKYCFYLDGDIEQFIQDNYGETILSYYHRICPKYGAARADFFRYLLIYKLGGVYLDIKSSLTKPLDSTLLAGDRFILSHWDNENPKGEYYQWGLYKELAHIPKGEFQQWHIIASAGHPLLRHVIISILHNIDTYNPYKVGVSTIGILRVTGPIAYSLAIQDAIDNEVTNFRLASNQEMGLQYSIYSAWEHKKKIKSSYNKRYYPVINIEQDGKRLKFMLFSKWTRFWHITKDIINRFLHRSFKRI